MINVLPPNPLTGPGIENIRALLREHETLLVHFNTPMTRHAVGFPQDLQDARANPHWKMCYSTVTAGDLGPGMSLTPGEARACGSVGLIVDLGSESVLIRICAQDGGSDGRAGNPGDGEDPTVEICRQAIGPDRSGHNEWYLSGGRLRGVFVHHNPHVYKVGHGELPVTWTELVDALSDLPIYMSTVDGFIEWSSGKQDWVPVTYDRILGYDTAAPS